MITTAKITEKCPLCLKTQKNHASFAAHRIDIHDGDDGRTGYLYCPIPSCSKKYLSRSAYRNHVSKHPSVETSVMCPSCELFFPDSGQLDRHLDAHEQTTRSELEDASHQEEGRAAVHALKCSLVKRYGSWDAVAFVMSRMVPVVLTLDDGSKRAVLGDPEIVEDLSVRNITNTHIVRHEETATDPVLSEALLAHPYGGIVLDNLSIYCELDTKICRMEFGKSSAAIGKSLAGALIQSQSSILLVLKAEPYGLRSTEDPHSQDLLQPTTGPYAVAAVRHDNTRKIIIATDSWQALITSAVMLDTGEVIVGPHNKVFTPHRGSKIWTRSDFQENIVVERHVRSKFNEPRTYLKCAGVFHEFQRHSFLPVTLATLYDHFVTSDQSGIKAISRLFFVLYETGALSKTTLDEVVAVVPKDHRAYSSLQALQEMAKAVGENDRVEISVPMSHHLRAITAFLPTTITEKNHSDVKNAIIKRIGDRLNEVKL